VKFQEAMSIPTSSIGKYCERETQSLTPKFTKSNSGVGGFAAKQAVALEG